MELLLFSFILIRISLSSRLPINSSDVQLSPQHEPLTVAEIDSIVPVRNYPWPPLPYLCHVKNGISINLTSYGDMLSRTLTANVLQSLIPIRHLISDAGSPDDVLEAITKVGVSKGDVYTEIGFYSLHPPDGIKRSQAIDVLNKVWHLIVDFYAAKEITSASIILHGGDLALFRLSFGLA